MNQDDMINEGAQTGGIIPSNSDLMQWVLDPKDLVNALRNYFEGVMPEVRNGKVFLARVSEPLMNKTGINTVLMAMHAINKQSLMSELSGQEICDIIGDLNDDLIEAIAINTNRFNNRWEVKSGDRSLILTAAVNSCRAALQMARDAGFRKDVRTMETVSRSIVDAPTKGPSIFNKRF